ncbi:hypothetical protein D3C76_1672560 [compost metagenome]
MREQCSDIQLQRLRQGSDIFVPQSELAAFGAGNSGYRYLGTFGNLNQRPAPLFACGAQTHPERLRG